MIFQKKKQKKNPLFLVNPVIKHKSKSLSVYEEGCLSLPGHYAEIERPAECNLSYIDYDGKERDLHAKGLLATCIQHEVDHLNGVLFIDHLSAKRKNILNRKLQSIKKGKFQKRYDFKLSKK